MSAGQEIVRYRSEHRESVAQLQTALWGPDLGRNARYFEWKYEQNPWAVEPRIYLALRSGSVVGMRGFYESRWEVGTPRRVVSIPLADDLAIRPGDRNSGLVTQIMRTALTDLADSGSEYVFSLSAGLLTTLGSLALGWKSAAKYAPVTRYERELAWRAQIRHRLGRTPLLWRLSRSPMLRSGAERAPFRRLDAGRPSAPGLVIGKQPWSEAMARLVADLGHDGRLRHVRDREYLDWRFANPMHEYRFLYAPGRDGLDGYLVLRSRVMGAFPDLRVCIADLEGRSARIRADLLAAATKMGHFAELMAWTSTLQPAERTALVERGFEPTDPHLAARGCPCVLVRSTRDGAAPEWALESHPLLDPASWDLRMLYSMAG